MDSFEREQQQKFMREIEEHKRQLESQQAQHSHILGKIKTFTENWNSKRLLL